MYTSRRYLMYPRTVSNFYTFRCFLRGKTSFCSVSRKRTRGDMPVMIHDVKFSIIPLIFFYRTKKKTVFSLADVKNCNVGIFLFIFPRDFFSHFLIIIIRFHSFFFSFMILYRCINTSTRRINHK